MKKEFMYAFFINRMVIFEVAYYTLGSNKSPYFTTSAGRFIRSKRDYDTCGQCQEEVLNPGTLARKFYDKWDKLHLKDLTIEEHTEILKDIEELKAKYKYIEKDPTPTDNNFSFYKLVDVSKTVR